MQPVVILERFLLAFGAYLMLSSLLTIGLTSTAQVQQQALEIKQEVHGRFAKLRPMPYIPPLPKQYVDGSGIELLVGKLCLQANQTNQLEVKFRNCTFSPEQNFNWTTNHEIDIVLEEGFRHCLQVSPRDNVTLELAICNRSRTCQQWDFQEISGRYKRYGALRHVGTRNCLARKVISSGDTLVVEPCVERAVRAHLTCEQAWYLPRAHQSYFRKDFKPFPLHRMPSATPHTGGKWLPKQLPKPAGKVLCWVLTIPEGHAEKALAVKRTWGARCDKLVFVTSEDDDDLGTLKVNLHGPEGRDKIWNKTKAAWLHVYKNHIDDAEWFFKADDDTYVVMDHFQKHFATKKSSALEYYGRPFVASGVAHRSYYSGGSGYVLSRATLKLLGDVVNSTNGSLWNQRATGPEDLLFADILRKLDIRIQPNVDDEGRQLFLPLGPSYEWHSPNSKGWFYQYSPEAKRGSECCSEEWISSHYVRSDDMYRMDNLETLKCPQKVHEWPHWKSKS
eukprot:m.11148 g.11148  ORF g.11148 m.11148 type:complete len:505 (-) comp8686_c0_seq1:90-1604(-)